MTIDSPNSTSPPAHLAATLTPCVTITVTNNGSISPSSYDATEGWACVVMPVPGGTFTGSVKVMNGSTQIASWAVDPNNVYTVPAPPTPPLTTCTLTTGITNGGNGTINIGSKPPGASLPAPRPNTAD